MAATKAAAPTPTTDAKTTASHETTKAAETRTRTGTETGPAAAAGRRGGRRGHPHGCPAVGAATARRRLWAVERAKKATGAGLATRRAGRQRQTGSGLTAASAFRLVGSGWGGAVSSPDSFVVAFVCMKLGEGRVWFTDAALPKKYKRTNKVTVIGVFFGGGGGAQQRRTCSEKDRTAVTTTQLGARALWGGAASSSTARRRTHRRRAAATRGRAPGA